MTENRVYGVPAPENNRVKQPGALMPVRFNTYLLRRYFVRDHGIALSLPPGELDGASIFMPIGDSQQVLDIGKTLQSKTMTAIGVPESEHLEIMEKIESELRKNNNISRIIVDVWIPTWQECDYDDYLTLSRAYEGDDELVIISRDDELFSSPATESSVDALEKFVVVEDDDRVECRVCLEAIEVSESAIRMPCLHVYHQNCIVKWLHQRHSCPICRHELPAELGFEDDMEE
ncbi:uncharacterized protein LOC126657444 [Mercurialis annua]|uniref:uncharacterized protein LOC126657444 n=1 Tax=Mercurialis annua TaxID=3986 RepID=UPI002160F5A0|nr:uncharacterized protein LOC126657444 [Mercurialis annua]